MTRLASLLSVLLVLAVVVGCGSGSTVTPVDKKAVKYKDK